MTQAPTGEILFQFAVNSLHVERRKLIGKPPPRLSTIPHFCATQKMSGANYTGETGTYDKFSGGLSAPDGLSDQRAQEQHHGNGVDCFFHGRPFAAGNGRTSLPNPWPACQEALGM
jgi:hypothetical protein